MQFTLYRSTLQEYVKNGRKLWYSESLNLLYWHYDPCEETDRLVLVPETLVSLVPDDGSDTKLRIEAIKSFGDRKKAMNVWVDAHVDVVVIIQGNTIQTFGRLEQGYVRRRFNNDEFVIAATIGAGWTVCRIG